jgi:hypothetical protein
MTSSSFHYEEVAAARARRFHELRCAAGGGEKLLEAFHGDLENGPSAFTVRMCRSDAQTMSRSRVRVDHQGVRWIYLEERPDLAGEPRRIEARLE